MPFSCWAIDTIIGLSPPAPDGSTAVVVCVDCVTKWAEVGIVQHVDSYHTARFFNDSVLCRYGVPRVVRSD